MSTHRDVPSAAAPPSSSDDLRTTKRTTILALAPLLLLGAATAWYPSDPTVDARPGHGRAMPFAPAQATAVPPIATCPPPPPGSTEMPPGLYPIVRVSDVTIYHERLPDGCPTQRWILMICIRNDGPAPMGAFVVRVHGCGFQAFEVTVDEVDMFAQRCIEVPGADIAPSACEIMLDPGCTQSHIERHWSAAVMVGEPWPTCVPTSTAGTPTAVGTPTTMATDDRETATAGATASREPEGTPVGPYAVTMPWAGAGRGP